MTDSKLDDKYDPPTREQLEGEVAGVALAVNGNPDHGPYVVFRAVCGAHGYYCDAPFRDPVGHGGGATPREAMISLARSLRDTADKLIVATTHHQGRRTTSSSATCSTAAAPAAVVETDTKR